MLTQGEAVEAHALRKRGWSISAIARHLKRDRKTVRACLEGRREPGKRKPAGPGRFERFAAYCEIRFGDDPHLWATALFDEVTELGYDGSYPSFTRALRARGLRPECEDCANAGVPGEFSLIDHPAGAETQWDWVELPDPPPAWGQGKHAHLLVGALPYSGAWRGVLAESERQPYLVASLHGVCERLGGVTRDWRFDRMSTVCHPDSGDLTASFAQVAKYYGVTVRVCPAFSGWRKGTVEKANRSAAQRWWRTLPDEVTPAQAQARLDRWCQRQGDARPRSRDGRKTTVGALLAAEPLAPLPQAPYPAVIEDTRTVSAQALVPWHGNRYSVPPGHGGQRVTVRHRLGSGTVDVATASGTVLARHRREPDHAGALVRDEQHVADLEKKVMAARAGRGRPCSGKERRPPSPAALAEAAAIRGGAVPAAPVTDFAAWAAGARPLRPEAPAAGGQEERA
jgi:transposase